MAFADCSGKRLILAFIFIIGALESNGNDILGCGGFVKSHVSLDFSKIEIGLYTKEGSLKEKTECAPTNGYYFLPLYEKGEYVLKVHPPAGWSFEPSQVQLSVDGVGDKCSTGQDINFSFNGFGITGRVITAGQAQGPGGIEVQLVGDKGEERKTVTTVGGDFHFTPVIPGKYTLKASHQRWKLDPAQAIVQVKEGNTALPAGVLAVKGYDVSGSISSFGSPIGNLYVLLYSKEESPKFRVEGCKTALLQGVPDSPICHVTTDGNGQFSFGLVPAGEYKLRVMSVTPGQPSVSYNVKPELVPFTVRHDSLFIKNAFEVTGFNVIGSVLSAPDKGLSGVRVSLDGTPAGKSDASGKFTLAGLIPAVYTISFQHEKCELEDVRLEVGTSGPRSVPQGGAARWRVCGGVTPRGMRHVALTSHAAPTAIVSPDIDGKWCTFLPPGTYTAKVEVSEQEQSEGLQFYPLSQKVVVSSSPVDGINFSQLKATLTGTIVCKKETDCAALPVTLRPLSADGAYAGQPSYAKAIDGKYKFEEVLPGNVEVSVSSDRLCWLSNKHTVSVTQTIVEVPVFIHSGYVLRMHATHQHEVEYSSASSKGVFAVPSGPSAQCVDTAEVLTLTPRGCHKFQPPQTIIDVAKVPPTTVHFVAMAHAVTVTVTSPEPVTDLVLTIDRDRTGVEVAGGGPLSHVKEGGMYVFKHTLYMPEGEIVSVSAFSSSLLFSPSDPQQIVGLSECQPHALTLRARSALTLKGVIVPPVADVTVTLTSDDVKLTQVTSQEGSYSFGPLDAAKSYNIVAEKESYVFSEPDDKGRIKAHKLAEIIVNLVDDADSTPLQGGLVSVSGGSYRRNAASPASGSLRFSSLSPGEYYIKPNMKEFRFAPSHHILLVEEGKTHSLTLRGTRVAWSCVGWLLSLGGVGWSRASLAATPVLNSLPQCAAEDAITDAEGAFRIRGLLPDCVYTLTLKESSTPELQGLKLVKAPDMLQVKDKKDIKDVIIRGIQASVVTEGSVVVRTSTPDMYRTLRLTLAMDTTPDTPIYAAKLDPTGYTQQMNPGLMYVLPRLPADNKTYVLALESSLSKSTHSYSQQSFYFNADGKYKSFTIDFLPKVKSSEQELRQTSLLVIPLLGILAFLYTQRWRLAAALPSLATLKATVNKTTAKAPRPEVLDKASIDHILNTVNPPKKTTKKKPAFL